MPYLEYLFCEHCGDYARLDINPGATIDAYNAEGREKSFINPATVIWDYLVYTCGICGRSYRYTYRDVEFRVREYFSSFSEEFKEYFDKVAELKSENMLHKEPPKIKVGDLTTKRVRDLYSAKST